MNPNQADTNKKETEGFAVEGQENYWCGSYWNRGQRMINQDSLAYWHMSKGNKNRILGIVCDGIGGASEGENASGFLVERITAWFLGRSFDLNRRRMETGLSQLLFQCHEQLKEYGLQKGIRLGSTLTMFVICEPYLYWCHTGDSRFYFFRGNRIHLMTRDDVQAPGVLDRALGMGEWRGISLGVRRIRPGDGILLCTDGFYRGLKKEEMDALRPAGLGADEQINRRLAQIGERKLFLGEKDNLTALYCVKNRKG